MPDAKWEGYHAPIGRSVTSLTVVLRRKCRLLLLRVRAAESDPNRRFATISCCIAKGLFDHLICGHKQGLRHGEAECLGSFEIYDQLVLSRLLHRQIRGLLAL